MDAEGVDMDLAIDLGLDAGVGDVDVRGGIDVVGEGGREGLDDDDCDGNRADRPGGDSSAEAGAPATDDPAPGAPSLAARAELGRLAAAAEANDPGPWSGVIFNRARRRVRPRSSASSALLASPRELPSHRSPSRAATSTTRLLASAWTRRAKICIDRIGWGGERSSRPGMVGRDRQAGIGRPGSPVSGPGCRAYFGRPSSAGAPWRRARMPTVKPLCR